MDFLEKVPKNNRLRRLHKRFSLEIFTKHLESFLKIYENRMSSSVPFRQCNEINALEKHYIQTYAGNLYESLNKFLLNTDTLQTYRRIYPQELAQNLYYLITNRPELYVNGTIPLDEEERVVELIRTEYGNIEWFRHIMFSFATSLYGIILKCPRLQDEVEVYRGVLMHYLKEDTNSGYFLNTFTSTSVDYKMARSFSKNNNRDVIIYHFRIMPGVACIYIGKNESELLLNPYQFYSFIRKDNNHYYYIIRPSNITPPYSEDEFSEFKRNIATRRVAMEGGKIENRNLHISRSTYRNTRRSKNRKAQHTKKNKMNSEMYHFKKRMNMPIGTSSFGIPLTPKMIEENERYYRDIEQRIKNGLH